MDFKEFVEKFCKNCKEICDKGMIEGERFIRCIDRDIYVNRNTKNN